MHDAIEMCMQHPLAGAHTAYPLGHTHGVPRGLAHVAPWGGAHVAHPMEVHVGHPLGHA